MIKQLALIFAFLALGELIVAVTHIPIPSSIIGMIFLTLSLSFKIIKLEWVEKISNVLVKNMGFFFIPAGVGIMNCFGIISSSFIAIAVSILISTILVIIATGTIHASMSAGKRWNSVLKFKISAKEKE